MKNKNPKFSEQTTMKQSKKLSKDEKENLLKIKLDKVMNNMLFHLHNLVSEDPANEKTRFVVNDENREVLKDLKFYLAKQPGKLDYRKGILFHGKVGNGKTLVLEMMKRCLSDMWGKNLIIFTAPFIKLQFYTTDREPQMSY